MVSPYPHLEQAIKRPTAHKKKKCSTRHHPIPSIPQVHTGCPVKIGPVHFDICKPILKAVVNPLIETINETLVTPLNVEIGAIDFSVCEMEQWWDFVKDDVNALIQDINILYDILNMNLFAYFQGWIRAVTGLPLTIVFWIAILIAIFFLVSWLGGFLALLHFFL